MGDAFSRLQELLRELFQFDNKDLDFGIYRIMNHKRGAVEDFIRNGLADAVDRALEGGAVARQVARAEELQLATQAAKTALGEAAIDPSGELDPKYTDTPAGSEYLEVRSRAGTPVDLEGLRAEIFNHVYTFFSRYYDNGDFLSKRRYSRRQKYAIPYNGEEVYLHWANADQYYIKTGEHFTDYRYKSKDGVTVHFELGSADTEQNNVKGDKRFFVPRAKEASYDEQSRTLTVPFEYRPLTAKEEKAYGTRNQQDKIIVEAAGQLPNRFGQQPEAQAALDGEKRKNAKGEPVSLLEHHLRRYTRRNTSDFFVHKNLKGFLEGELDFYLKNEVLDVDDLDSWGPERSESWFEVMRAVKGVGRSIIAFLAQIEDFQKKLFEKKKLVVDAGYCLTLDRVPEGLYEEVAACEAQREEWVRLFAIDEIEQSTITPGYTEPLTVDFLKANPHLVLDTKHFGDDFKDRLLADIEDLDPQLDGLLVESENFQALNLLQERYREQVKCIYIDPPYNTGGDDFLYKDSYQHSSWLTMMENRLRLGREMLDGEGVSFVSIDDNEQANLKRLLDGVFEADNFVADVIWQKKYAPQNDAKWFSDDHDFLVCYARDKWVWRPEKLPRSEEQNKLYSNPDNDPRGPWMSDNYTSNKSSEERPNLFYAISNPQTGEEIWPSKSAVWRYTQEQHEQHTKDNRVWWGINGTNKTPRYKRFLSEVGSVVPRTLWMYKDVGHNQDALRELRNIFGDVIFSAPKPTRLIQRVATVGRGEVMLDFFAGSGTTGHAVIDLNREDGGDRRYVLVEMGEYFDTVLKPRILKVIYSKDWKDGKPVSREGTSHALKYLKLESYEDTLDNISFVTDDQSQKMLDSFGEDYRLRYMLDFETRGSDSLLNVEKLSAPFRYELRLQNGDEKHPAVVDLPETFAYLLGLRVRTRKAYHDGKRRYLVYRGSSPERGEIAAIWRDTEDWTQEDYERDERFVEEEGFTQGADEVFVNGDSFIPGSSPLETLFKRRMLAGPGHG